MMTKGVMLQSPRTYLQATAAFGIVDTPHLLIHNL
jgi:hypothetical protein